MSQPSAFQRFAHELRRRHVPQTAAVYLVAAWAAIEFSDVVVPNLNGPQWIVTAVIVAALVGFPIVLILAWVFDWGAEGLHRTDSPTGDSLEPLGADTADAPAGSGPVPGSPERATPWMAALAVLVVTIGSALAVAAVIQSARVGEGTAAESPGRDGAEPIRPPEAPREPFALVPLEGFEGMEDSLRRQLEGLEEIGGWDLSELARLGAMGAMDTMTTEELMEVVVDAAESSGVTVFIQQPAVWRVSRGAPAPLRPGDTLTVRGVAGHQDGVRGVWVDGEQVAEAGEDDSRPLRFTARVVGTGDRGRRVLEIVVRTGAGDEVRTEWPIQQLPPDG